MAINFPSNPNVNDTHTVGSTVWTWNGTSWTGQSHDPIEIATLTYPSVDGTNGQVLTTDGAGNLTFGDVTLGSIDNLTDVDITSVAPTDGQVLVWSTADSKFVPGSNAGYSDSAVDTHLNTSTATSNQVLSWDGADYAWVAQSSGGGTLGASISGVEESFSVIENATGTVTHDCDNGHIFYHKTPSADWTVNLTNLGLTNHYATAITIIIQQGATAYIPNALQIGGASTGIRWASNTTPTGNANSTDQVTFSIMTDGTTTFALGQLSTYGEGTGTLSAPAPTVSTLSWYGDRGLYAGGTTGTSDQIEYISVNISANATDFGNLTVARGQMGGASNGTRAVWTGGYEYGNSLRSNVMDYVTIATTGNAQDFGDLTEIVSALFHGVVGDGTYGFRCAGVVGAGTRVPTIDKWTIDTTGNASDHGDLTVERIYAAAACDGTYGLVGGGAIVPDPYFVNIIDSFTTATASNATDFGDLQTLKYSVGVGFDTTRAVFAGGTGGASINVAAALSDMDYVTMATPGNASDFGDITAGEYPAGTSDGTYVCFASGNGLGANIHKITIQTLGNATDTGYDLLTSYSNGAGGVSGSSS